MFRLQCHGKVVLFMIYNYKHNMISLHRGIIFMQYFTVGPIEQYRRARGWITV